MKMGPFLNCVSVICRLEEKSVRIFGRELRDAGLLTTGARGLNAPDMTPRDLAVMLIALLGTDRPSKAPEMVEYFGKMQLAAPDLWASGGTLPKDPHHSFLDLMLTICDPEVRVPDGVRISFTGAACASVENEDLDHELLDGARAPMSFMYHPRGAMQRLVDGKANEDDEDRLSLRGIQTTREIAAPCIELLKDVLFRVGELAIVAEAEGRTEATA